MDSLRESGDVDWFCISDGGAKMLTSSANGEEDIEAKEINSESAGVSKSILHLALPRES